MFLFWMIFIETFVSVLWASLKWLQSQMSFMHSKMSILLSVVRAVFISPLAGMRLLGSRRVPRGLCRNGDAKSRSMWCDIWVWSVWTWHRCTSSELLALAVPRDLVENLPRKNWPATFLRRLTTLMSVLVQSEPEGNCHFVWPTTCQNWFQRKAVGWSTRARFYARAV